MAPSPTYKGIIGVRADGTRCCSAQEGEHETLAEQWEAARHATRWMLGVQAAAKAVRRAERRGNWSRVLDLRGAYPRTPMQARDGAS